MWDKINKKDSDVTDMDLVLMLVTVFGLMAAFTVMMIFIVRWVF